MELLTCIVLLPTIINTDRKLNPGQLDDEFRKNQLHHLTLTAKTWLQFFSLAAEIVNVIGTTLLKSMLSGNSDKKKSYHVAICHNWYSMF
jgi:hypothetical protein